MIGCIKKLLSVNSLCPLEFLEKKGEGHMCPLKFQTEAQHCAI